MAKKAMSPSSETISSGQIGKIQELIGAALRKSNLPFLETQSVLENQGGQLITSFMTDLRRRVEAIPVMIVRYIKVDRTRAPQKVLDATGCKQYTDAKVVATMPRGEHEETDIFFFNLGRYVSDKDLDKEFDLRGLKPADPYTVAQLNTDDPGFAVRYPNGTHWKIGEHWHYIAFKQWEDVERRVNVELSDYDWGAYWWFAGVRK